MRNRLEMLTTTILLGALVLAGCVQGGEAALEASGTQGDALVVDAHAGMPDDDLRLHPDPLVVPAGSRVELRIRNDGVTGHTFTIHDYDVDTGMLAPGESATLRFTALREGSFEIMCDAPGHYAAGMKATLEVRG